MLLLTLFMLMIMMISMILLILNYLISKKKINNREKSSPFECGFDPLSKNRLPFSIQFYLISMIFLIFDIEIIILLPLIPSMIYYPLMNSSLTLLMFMLILNLGLYMEWNDGALTWLK